MEKICQNCRQSSPPNAVFCRHCAASLSQVNPQQPAGNQGQQFNQQFNPQNAGFQQQAGGFAPTANKASGRAIAAAALAVGGLFCCGAVLGIPAAILGYMEMTAIKEGRASSKGMMLAQVGLWVGIIGSVITSFVGLLLTLSSGGGGYYGY